MIKISNNEKQIFIEWMGRFYLGKKQETNQQLASLEKDITDNILVKKKHEIHMEQYNVKC